MNQLDVVADWLAEFTGSRRDAERYVASLLAGYLESLEKDGNGRFQAAMEDLSTEGGLNNQLGPISGDQDSTKPCARGSTGLKSGSGNAPLSCMDPPCTAIGLAYLQSGIGRLDIGLVTVGSLVIAFLAIVIDRVSHSFIVSFTRLGSSQMV